ncbi:MAG: cytidylate kinase family protein [Nanoarchaeota archaeon]|nr:cytidylate kinase family protein [Nanoarchaeota archaeon]MBU1855042.1 cytidylate kinase family protein [Nanoarchaeota archaeon]
MKITVTGFPGSGNSTLARMLAKKLNHKFYSAGDMRKKMAIEKGMTIAEFNKLGETEDWTDKRVDEYLVRIGKKENDFVLDSKIADYLVPEAFKIFLKAKLEVRAERVLKEKRVSEPFKNLEDAKKFLMKRVRGDKRRYKKYYNYNAYNSKNFDLVIDTTNLTPEQILVKVMKKIGF